MKKKSLLDKPQIESEAQYLAYSGCSGHVDPILLHFILCESSFLRAEGSVWVLLNRHALLHIVDHWLERGSSISEDKCILLRR